MLPSVCGLSLASNTEENKKKKKNRKETVTRWEVECCHSPRAPSRADVKQKRLHKVTLSIETVAGGLVAGAGL